MNEAQSRRTSKPKFSLANLLTLIALCAMGTAIALAYRNHYSMNRYRDQLLALSSRLQVIDEDELASSELPTLADDFHSWNVYVPSGQNYELRLGMGAVSTNGIPPIVGAAQISPGRHRVTLYTGDTPSEEFRYVVYVDEQPVIEKAMGSDWIPGGWSSASGISWPNDPTLSEAIQLSARSYETRTDFGQGNYFNGDSDGYVTQDGYRLWIDQSDSTYAPASPFMGFANDQRHLGIGLRDGLRYESYQQTPYEWTFTRPSLQSNAPVLRISSEFFAGDEKILSGQIVTFQSWVIRNAATGAEALNWQADPAQPAHSAFLHVNDNRSVDTPLPVVELKWEVDRPDEVGLRLADTPANDTITRWRLRILGGTMHLWRQMRIDDRSIDVAELDSREANEGSGEAVDLEVESSGQTDIRLRWETNETLPLQVLVRKQRTYAGMRLYRGLPLAFEMQIPTALQPNLQVKIADEYPQASGTAFPGGAVFEEIQIELEAGHDWIWLKAESKPAKPEKASR